MYTTPTPRGRRAYNEHSPEAARYRRSFWLRWTSLNLVVWLVVPALWIFQSDYRLTPGTYIVALIVMTFIMLPVNLVATIIGLNARYARNERLRRQQRWPKDNYAHLRPR